MKAFVLLPFQDEFEDIYDDVVKPSLEGNGYEVSKADSDLNQQNIMRDVVKGIDEADIVIADLTTLNSNVLYELGIAHGLGVPVVMITQEIDELPFDLRAYRVVPYSTDFRHIGRLREALTDIGAGKRDGSVEFGSPLTDFAQSFRARGAETTARTIAVEVGDTSESPLHAGDDEDGEDLKEFADYAVDVETALQTITDITFDWTGSTSEWSQHVLQASADMDVLAEANVPGRAARFLRAAEKIAKETRTFEEQLREHLPAFQGAFDDIGNGVAGMLQSADDVGADDVTSMISTRDAMRELEEVMEGTYGQITTMQQSVEGVPPASRSLTKATRSLGKTIGDVAGEIDLGRATVQRLGNLFDAKLDDTEDTDDADDTEDTDDTDDTDS